MSGIAGFFVFDETHFVHGQARILFSKLGNGSLTDQAVPASPADIFAQEQASGYDPMTPTGYSPWVDLGGTTTPPEYGIARTINNWRVQQQIAAVKAVPSEVVRTIKFTFAEFNRTDLLQLLENAGAAQSVSSATGHSAFTQIPFGQFTDLNEYRFAIAAFMPLDAGSVNESDGTVRPRLVVQACYRCAVDAANSTVAYALGEEIAPELTLRLYPESGQDQNQEQGSYFIEAAGTIS